MSGSGNENDKLTVIMPALNEEANIKSAIASTLQAFDAFRINGEIIVVDDGSADRTADLAAEKIKEDGRRIRIIRHQKPQGIGACFWEGVGLSEGDKVVMLPGDNENDPAEILRYYRLLEQVDMVVPFVFDRCSRPRFRNALSSVYRFIINATFPVNFNYTNGTILYRKSILRELDYHCRGFFFQTDILVRLAKKGYLFAEVPYKLGSRKSGVSKAVKLSSLWKVIKGYLRLVKDCYLIKDSRNNRTFSKDSLTALRR